MKIKLNETSSVAYACAISLFSESENNANGDAVDWSGETEEIARSAIEFALGGKHNRAWWICSETLNNKNQKTEKELVDACKALTDTYDTESLSKLTSSNTDPKILASSSDFQSEDSANKTVAGLLETWRDRNMTKLELGIN